MWCEYSLTCNISGFTAPPSLSTTPVTGIQPCRTSLVTAAGTGTQQDGTLQVISSGKLVVY